MHNISDFVMFVFVYCYLMIVNLTVRTPRISFTKGGENGITFESIYIMVLSIVMWWFSLCISIRCFIWSSPVAISLNSSALSKHSNMKWFMYPWLMYIGLSWCFGKFGVREWGCNGLKRVLLLYFWGYFLGLDMFSCWDVHGIFDWTWIIFLWAISLC